MTGAEIGKCLFVLTRCSGSRRRGDEGRGTCPNHALSVVVSIYAWMDTRQNTYVFPENKCLIGHAKCVRVESMNDTPGIIKDDLFPHRVLHK